MAVDGAGSGTDSLHSGSKTLSPSTATATRGTRHTPLSAAPVVKDLSGVKKKMPWHNKRPPRGEKETPDSTHSRSLRPYAYSKISDSPKVGVPDEPTKTQRSHSSAPYPGSSTPRLAQQSDASGSAFFVPPSSPTTETDPKPAESQPVDDEVLGFFFDPPIQPLTQSQLPKPAPPSVLNYHQAPASSPTGKRRFNWARDKTPEPAPAEAETSTVSDTPNSTTSTTRSRTSQHKHKKHRTSESGSGRRASALPQWAKQEVASSQSPHGRRQRGGSLRSNKSGRSTGGPNIQP